VIDVVEVDVLDIAGRGIDVPGNGDVDQEEETVTPPSEGRGDHLRAHDIPGGAGGGDHDIDLRQGLGNSVEGQGNSLERLRQFLRPFIGPVRDEDVARTLADQVTDCQLRHLPGPDDKDLFPLKVTEDLLRQFDGRVTDRNGVAGDPRLGSDPLRHPEGMVEKPVEEDRCRAVIDRLTIGLLQLPQDLRLPHDHGIETRRHAKEVAYRFPVPVDVKTAPQLLAFEVPLPVDELPKSLDGLLSVRHAGEDLHPVAGGKAERLPDLRKAHQLSERTGIIPAGELESLPDFERSRFMVHADKNESHLFTRNRGTSGKRASRPSAGRAG
jgi:hypothetical protein